ncbi:MAG: hypothetical protein JWP11_2221 [Frankiales bacterium]|nr:hypothetical protein [Frankiales bacterium]
MSRALALAVVAAAALGPLALGSDAEAASPTQVVAADGPRVIVIGAPGLRWSDVNAQNTPALAGLARKAATAVLSVRTAAPVDCPTDGWLSLSAGNRVRSTGRHTGRCPATFPAATSLPAQVRANADRREGAVPGLLADTLRAHGRCVHGGGPGGSLAAAGSDGTEAPPDTLAAARNLGGTDPLAGATARSDCDVLLLQATAVGSTARASGAAAVDALVARVQQLRPPASTLLVVGLSEAPGDKGAHLHVALAAGPGFGPAALTSASSRRPRYVQLVDLAPTVLSLLGINSPNAMIGEPWRATGGAPSIADLRDEERKSDGQRQVTVPFFVVLVGVQLLLVGSCLLLRRWRLVELFALAGTTAVGASYLANLVPWWRADSPLLAMLAATTAATALLTPICLLGKGLLARAGLACGLTATVLVIDVLTGAHLQMSSVAGYSPVVAGRFAGIGNVAFGVLAASVLLAAASTRSATVAALTALVVVADGAPMWGSDVGGVLALAPAYALLVLLLAGRKVSLARLAAAAGVGGLVVAAFGIADHARPEDQQTHLGRFVGQVLDGSAGGVVERKAEANVSLLFHSPVTALLPLVVAFLLLLFLRPPTALRGALDHSPAWRAGLLAVLTAGGLGFLLNDSGAAVPALAIVVAVPATLAVLARHARGPAGAG